MPKLGMGPIRREQICRGAARVIAREGFAGSTMRMVAEEAGVSTGMINHYYGNRQELLAEALFYVSERAAVRIRAALDGVPPGRERVVALLDSILPTDEEMNETWRVWINAYGEAVHLAELRHTLGVRLGGWYQLLDAALEGLVPADTEGTLSWSVRFDAILTGLTIRSMTSESRLNGPRMRDEVIRTLLGELEAPGAPRKPVAR